MARVTDWAYRVLTGLLVMVGVMSAAGAQVCPLVVGQKGSVTPLLPILQKAKGLKLKKDEFETTAAYQVRLAAAASGIPQEVITVAWPHEALTSYDADTETVTVTRYSLDTTCSVMDTSLSDEAKGAVFGEAPQQFGTLTMGTSYCMTRNVGGDAERSYTGSNSFGATTTVTAHHLKEVGLYLGYGASGQSMLPGRYDAPAMTFKATVAEARALKQNATFYIAIKAVAPFYTHGSYYIGPTIDSPTEIVEDIDFLVVQPVCAGLADKMTGNVYAVVDLSHPGDRSKAGL